jgi:hypothetical protein
MGMYHSQYGPSMKDSTPSSCPGRMVAGLGDGCILRDGVCRFKEIGRMFAAQKPATFVGAGKHLAKGRALSPEPIPRGEWGTKH